MRAISHVGLRVSNFWNENGFRVKESLSGIANLEIQNSVGSQKIVSVKFFLRSNRRPKGPGTPKTLKKVRSRFRGMGVKQVEIG